MPGGLVRVTGTGELAGIHLLRSFQNPVPGSAPVARSPREPQSYGVKRAGVPRGRGRPLPVTRGLKQRSPARGLKTCPGRVR